MDGNLTLEQIADTFKLSLNDAGRLLEHLKVGPDRFGFFPGTELGEKLLATQPEPPAKLSHVCTGQGIFGNDSPTRLTPDGYALPPLKKVFIGCDD